MAPTIPIEPAVPSTRVPSTNGVEIAVYDLGGAVGSRPLLLAHATGFCGAALAPLARAMEGKFHCFAFDERGHGSSGRPKDGDFDWHGFADDVLAVVDGLALERPFGFGHSCGGAALLLAEEQRPGTFDGLYLFEPVVVTSGPPLRRNPDNPMTAGALRRRSHFESTTAAAAHLASKPPLDALDPAALGAYVVNGFRRDPPGGITLACSKEDEAEIYACGFQHDAFTHLGTVRCPVTLACGLETEGFGPPFLSSLESRLEDARTVSFAGIGHFGPMQAPATVAQSVVEAFG